MAMKSETQANMAKFITMIKAVDPELYFIMEALSETKLNPVVIPPIIRALSNLYYGTGHGKVQIFMQDGKITSINPEERLKIDLRAVLNDTKV